MNSANRRAMLSTNLVNMSTGNAFQPSWGVAKSFCALCRRRSRRLTTKTNKRFEIGLRAEPRAGQGVTRQQIDLLILKVVSGGVCSEFRTVVKLKSVVSRAKKACSRESHIINIDFRQIASVVMPQNQCKYLTQYAPQRPYSSILLLYKDTHAYSRVFIAHLSLEKKRFCGCTSARAKARLSTKHGGPVRQTSEEDLYSAGHVRRRFRTHENLLLGSRGNELSSSIKKCLDSVNQHYL